MFSQDPPPKVGATAVEAAREAQVDRDREREGDAAGLRFSSHVEVLLVPSRTELRAAGCDASLWWRKLDFFLFQQKATSEVRLLALLQSISVSEAQRRLYQPDADPDGESWNYVQTDSTPLPSPSPSPSPSPLQTHTVRKSISRKPAVLGGSIVRSGDIESLSHSHSHPLSIASPTKTDSVTAIEIDDSLPFSPACPRNRVISWEDVEVEKNDPYADLHFCVPLIEPMNVKEKLSSSRKKNSTGFQFSTICSGFGAVLIGAGTLLLPMLGYCFLVNSGQPASM